MDHNFVWAQSLLTYEHSYVWHSALYAGGREPLSACCEGCGYTDKTMTIITTTYYRITIVIPCRAHYWLCECIWRQKKYYPQQQNTIHVAYNTCSHQLWHPFIDKQTATTCAYAQTCKLTYEGVCLFFFRFFINVVQNLMGVRANQNDRAKQRRRSQQSCTETLMCHHIYNLHDGLRALFFYFLVLAYSRSCKWLVGRKHENEEHTEIGGSTFLYTQH